MSSSPHSRSNSKRSENSEIPTSVFKELLEVFLWDPSSFDIILDELCRRYPHESPTAVESKLARILNEHELSPSNSPAHSIKVKRKKTGQLLKIEVDDALQIYDGYQMDNLIEYLSFISEHEHLTKEEIEDELRTVYGVTRPTASRRHTPSSHSKRTLSKDKETSPKKSRISEDDVNEGLEFYGFDFGPHLAENLVNYFHNKYPHLSRENIRKQLKPYDFLGSDVTKPTTPQRTPLTPQRRGELYEPKDFSPSIFGACSQDQIEWLRKKRAKYLPDYVSPPRRIPLSPSSLSPRPLPRRLSFMSPESDQHSPSRRKYSR